MTKILGPEVGYVDLLNYATEEFIKQDALKVNDRYPLRPSSSGKCTRELAFELMEYTGQAKYDKELITPEMHRIFALGHSVEYHIIKQLEAHAGEFFKVRYKQQMLSFFKVEAPTMPDLSRIIEGSIDACFISKDHKAVIDFKSKKDKFDAAFKSEWDKKTEQLSQMQTVTPIGDSGAAFWVEDLEAFLDELNDPFFAANFLQLNLYANSDFLIERGIDHGAIIQICKNDSRLREVRFKPHRGLYEAVKTKFERSLKAAESGNVELAPRDFVLGSVKCAFCPYKRECWKDDGDGTDPLKAFFKTLPAKGWPQDVSRLDGATASRLTELYSEFKQTEEATEGKEVLEKKIIEQMINQGVRKIRFDDGRIYELKHYKSPRPRIELKRSKI